MTDTDMQIRRAIRHRMVDLELSQAQLAERMGLSRQNVYHVLRGERGKLPKSLLEMLEALGLELVVAEKRGEPSA